MLQTIAQDAGVPGTTRFVVNLPQGPVAAGDNGTGGDER
jgi:hypothetical protein